MRRTRINFITEVSLPLALVLAGHFLNSRQILLPVQHLLRHLQERLAVSLEICLTLLELCHHFHLKQHQLNRDSRPVECRPHQAQRTTIPSTTRQTPGEMRPRS